ncbi:hypothetical protein [Flavobacterium pectinovorum]|uniref:Uncharacterized protein n=1 Tax=Flavobacterium pectinovorum TaxID=29533 RepID=A0A502ECR7_9FLAO|nr:hypothetical protein [Flavobacterium pectinovorum]TPG34762.1 hypothetical protein EAH81_22000 [Flavobacterium pectinovorum]
MYIKVSSTFNYFNGKYHLLRIYKDARTNEVYLLANNSESAGVYVPFDFTTLKTVDGGFYISCPVFNLKVEIRNKFF